MITTFQPFFICLNDYFLKNAKVWVFESFSSSTVFLYIYYIYKNYNYFFIYLIYIYIIYIIYYIYYILYIYVYIDTYIYIIYIYNIYIYIYSRTFIVGQKFQIFSVHLVLSERYCIWCFSLLFLMILLSFRISFFFCFWWYVHVFIITF